MPQRVTHVLALILGVLGLAVLAVLVLLGADLRRSARTGPRWKRALVGAGLVLLASLGFGRGSARGDDPAPTTQPAAGATGATTQSADPLAGASEWKALTETWTQAEEVASGKRGQYPFDQKGQAALLEALEQVGKQVTSLAARGLLSQAEADLLELERARLVQQVSYYRPTEMRIATCYQPLPMDFRARPAMSRLSGRLANLEKLAAAGILRPQVLHKIVPAVESDIKLLEDPEQLRALGADADKARQAVQAAKGHLEKMKARLAADTPSLEKTEGWGVVMVFWQHAAPLAESGRSTQAERQAVDTNQKTAAAAIDGLVKDGLLSQPEGALLKAEMARIRGEVYRNPPTDLAAECYSMAYVSPAEASLDRLAGQLEALGKLADSGKLQPAAIRKVLPAIEADLATLADPQKLNELKGPQRQKAQQLADQARKAVEQIRKLLPKGE